MCVKCKPTLLVFTTKREAQKKIFWGDAVVLLLHVARFAVVVETMFTWTSVLARMFPRKSERRRRRIIVKPSRCSNDIASTEWVALNYWRRFFGSPMFRPFSSENVCLFRCSNLSLNRFLNCKEEDFFLRCLSRRSFQLTPSSCPFENYGFWISYSHQTHNSSETRFNMFLLEIDAYAVEEENYRGSPRAHSRLRAFYQIKAMTQWSCF